MHHLVEVQVVQRLQQKTQCLFKLAEQVIPNVQNSSTSMVLRVTLEKAACIRVPNILARKFGLIHGWMQRKGTQEEGS